MPVTQKSITGAALITGGAVAGVGISTTIGGIGLAGGFGAIGIGMAPMMGVGAIAGTAMYGAFKAMGEGDATAWGAIGIGAVSGAGFSNFVGSMGFVAPKVGLAFGVGTVPLLATGAVFGLAAYGLAKLIDETETRETPVQLFERMEEKVLRMETLCSTSLELEAFLSGEDLNRQFATLEIEQELQALKAEVNHQPATPHTSTQKMETEAIYPQASSSGTWKCVQILKEHTAGVNAFAISPVSQTLVSASDDRTVCFWNLETGKWCYTFAGQAEAVLSVAISPDGKVVASGSVDRKITL